MSATHQFKVDDGAGHVYERDSLDQIRKLFIQLKYSGLLPSVYQREDGKYVLSQDLTDQMNSIPRMGRPSEGRSFRLQATITPEQMAWLEAQKGRYETNSVSDVVFRLIEEAMR